MKFKKFNIVIYKFINFDNMFLKIIYIIISLKDFLKEM